MFEFVSELSSCASCLRVQFCLHVQLVCGAELMYPQMGTVWQNASFDRRGIRLRDLTIWLVQRYVYGFVCMCLCLVLFPFCFIWTMSVYSLGLELIYCNGLIDCKLWQNGSQSTTEFTNPKYIKDTDWVLSEFTCVSLCVCACMRACVHVCMSYHEPR